MNYFTGFELIAFGLLSLLVLPRGWIYNGQQQKITGSRLLNTLIEERSQPRDCDKVASEAIKL